VKPGEALILLVCLTCVGMVVAAVVLLAVAGML